MTQNKNHWYDGWFYDSIIAHKVNEDKRIVLLNEIARVADKIIIGDYLVPKPGGFDGYFSEAIEFLAGAEHYRNYKNYMANGGIYHLANQAGLKIINEVRDQSSTNHLVVLAK